MDEDNQFEEDDQEDDEEEDEEEDEEDEEDDFINLVSSDNEIY